MRAAAVERVRARRAAAFKKGICTQCCRRPALEDSNSCRACLDYQNDWQQQHFDERREDGVCVGCGTAPVEGKRWRCDPCQALQKKRQDAFLAQRKADGICTRCPNPSRPGLTECGEHPLRPHRRTRKRRRT